MSIRKMKIAGLALAVLTLFAITACDFSVWIIDPPGTDPDPDPSFTYGLEFSLEWTDNGAGNPHLYMTYPAPADGNTTDDWGVPTFTDPYFPTLGGDTGFGLLDVDYGLPNEAEDERGVTYYGDRYSSYPDFGDSAIEMTDIKDTTEVILVREFPFTSYDTNLSTSGGGDTLLEPGYYTWVGVMEVYAYATTGQLAYADGDGVDAVLNVYEDGDLFASYTLPTNTNLQGSSIVRINCFYDDWGYEIYQLVPDIRLINSTTGIRSVSPDAAVSDNGVVVIRRPAAE